jgi:hypothetical protein
MDDIEQSLPPSSLHRWATAIKRAVRFLQIGFDRNVLWVVAILKGKIHYKKVVSFGSPFDRVSQQVRRRIKVSYSKSGKSGIELKDGAARATREESVSLIVSLLRDDFLNFLTRIYKLDAARRICRAQPHCRRCIIRLAPPRARVSLVIQSSMTSLLLVIIWSFLKERVPSSLSVSLVVCCSLQRFGSFDIFLSEMTFNWTRCEKDLSRRTGRKR